MSLGTVYLVGAGPGDPGLVTQRARDLIERADVVIYDALVNARLLSWCRKGCERINVGKKPGRHNVPQEEIQEIILDRARKVGTVVRLKGGDPFVFGRGGEESKALVENSVPFEVVPGVTAALAGGAYAGVPVTNRGFSSAVCFLTGHENPDTGELLVDFRKYAEFEGTLCVYMGMHSLERIVGQLMEGGKPGETPVTVVQWATLPQQRSLTARLDTAVDKVGAAGLEAPAVVYIGEVAAFSERLNWSAARALSGKRVAVTRGVDQSASLARELEEMGADVLEIPLIQARPDVLKETAEDVFAEFGTYEWIIFTSPNGVRFFFKEFFKRYDDIRSLGLARLAVVGGGTAKALKRLRLKEDFTPEKANADALAKELGKDQSLENLRVLVISGNLNDGDLVSHLEDQGAMVDNFQVYRTDPVDLRELPDAERFRREGANAILFASGSAARNFKNHAAELQLVEGARLPKGVSIGPSTSKVMKELGLPVDAEAREQSVAGLAEAVRKLLQ